MNNKNNDTIKKLQQNIEIPEIVWEKANDAVFQTTGRSLNKKNSSRNSTGKFPSDKAFIPNSGAKNSDSRILHFSPCAPEPYRRNRKAEAAAAAIAVCILGGTALLAANPTLAERLPLIGRIFSQVEDTTRFSGDFSSRADVLTQESKDNSADKAVSDTVQISGAATDTPSETASSVSADTGKASSAAGQTTYTATDQGMTLTASEVYCDGMAVYITFQADYEGSLGTIPASYTGGTTDGTTAQTFYTHGTWTLDEGEENYIEDGHLEGKQLDDHSFAGMLRIDLGDTALKNETATLHLSFNRTGADDLDADNTDPNNIEPALYLEGNWEFDIPIHVDQESVKTMDVQQTGENGYGVLSVTKSLYQVTVRTTYPGFKTEITDEEKASTIADYRKALEQDDEFSSEDIEEIISDLTDEDILYLAANYDNAPEVAVFTQDGEPLDPYIGIQNSYTFAIQNKEITSLTVYVGCDEFGDLSTAQTQEEAAQKAYFSTTVDFS